MSQPYSLLFLGHQSFKQTLAYEDSIDCWQQVTAALNECLGAVDHIDYTFRDNHGGRPKFYDRLPKADAVLFWGVPQTWTTYDHARLKRSTGCRAIITVCERPLTAHADWAFAFIGGGENTTRVDAPVLKRLYNQLPKTPRSVLIDHWDQDSPSDWTRQIEDWVEDLSTEFAVTRYLQNDGRRSGDRGHAQMRDLHRSPFSEWLASTDRLETFVMTHWESYGYAILDMAARGIRLACPTPFAPPHLRERFSFETFSTREELFNILRAPPSPSRLTGNREQLTDWRDLVQLIDRRIEALLHGREPASRMRFARDHQLRAARIAK